MVEMNKRGRTLEKNAENSDVNKARSDKEMQGYLRLWTPEDLEYINMLIIKDYIGRSSDNERINGIPISVSEETKREIEEKFNISKQIAFGRQSENWTYQNNTYGFSVDKGFAMDEASKIVDDYARERNLSPSIAKKLKSKLKESFSSFMEESKNSEDAKESSVYKNVESYEEVEEEEEEGKMDKYDRSRGTGVYSDGRSDEENQEDYEM